MNLAGQGPDDPKECPGHPRSRTPQAIYCAAALVAGARPSLVGEPLSEPGASLDAFRARGQPLPAIVSRIPAAPRTALRLAYRI
jgi:hypothetical protein